MPSTLRPVSVRRVKELERATSAYQSQLSLDAEFWLKARGIDAASIAGSRLGEAAEPLPGHERYQGMLAIPYLVKQHEPVTVRFRCLKDHDCRDRGHGKYMSMPDEPPRIYNLSAIHTAGDEIHIAEGELDAIILNQCDYQAVAIPGAQVWQPWMRRLFLGFSKIYVWTDPDEAGNKLYGHIRNALPESTIRVPMVDKDVNDMYIAAGADALHDLKRKADTDDE